jgi:hypothetical protein
MFLLWFVHCVVQIANHPLLIRRIYSQTDVESLAKKLHKIGVFGFECTLERVQEELMSYSDYALHKVNQVPVLNCIFWWLINRDQA